MFTTKKSLKLKCVSIFLLLVYCFGISSLFISHNHDDLNYYSDSHENHNNELTYCEHHDNDLTFCESINDFSNQYNQCSHSSHLNNDKASCLLCDHTAFIDDSTLNNSNNHKNQLFFDEIISLSSTEYLIALLNISNKSPPTLI